MRLHQQYDMRNSLDHHQPHWIIAHCSQVYSPNRLVTCKMMTVLLYKDTGKYNEDYSASIPSSALRGLQVPYLFGYKPILAISRDPKLWTCRLGITRTKNKSKTPGYKPRPIHYYKTELLTTGKPNMSTKQSRVRNRLFQVKLSSCPRLVVHHTTSRLNL